MTITPTVVLIALAIGIIGGIISVVVVIRKYSMKHDPVDYPLDQFTRLNLEEQSDLFTGKEVHSRVISEDRDKRR